MFTYLRRKLEVDMFYGKKISFKIVYYFGTEGVSFSLIYSYHVYILIPFWTLITMALIALEFLYKTIMGWYWEVMLIIALNYLWVPTFWQKANRNEMFALINWIRRIWN